MKQNMGKIDRVLRFFVIGPLAIWGAAAITSGAWSILLYAVAVIMFVTAFVGFCPTYTLVHVDTRSRRVKFGT